MRVLVFDTETTGLPKSKFISPDTLNLWPYIVQFSFVIYDTEENDIVETSDTIVKVKEGINITAESTQFHGITNEISQEKGVNVETILKIFFNNLKNVDMLIGHNISFDINMVKVELLRLIYTDNSSEDEIKTYKQILHFFTNFTNICCTMQDSIELCKIKAVTKFGKEYFKFPKLIELHQELFNSTPNNLHNSFNDILVTLRCFMKLKLDIDLNEKCNSFKKIAIKINLL